MYGLVILITFISCAVFSYFLNKVLLKNSISPGVSSKKVEEGGIRWASRSKPTVGGISFFITFVLASLFMLVLNSESLGSAQDFLALVVASTVGFLLGLQDDAYSTRPLLKLGGQVLCGVVMVAFGVSIDLFHIPILDYTLTIFWVVGIMNSINLLDNMDGVTGAVSLVILVSTIVMLSLFREVSGLLYFSMVAVAGSLLGFLILNWKPSKIYMGDTGSQFLGAFLAFAGIKFLWNIQFRGSGEVTSIQVLAPLMAFLVPIMDTSFVTFARILRGRSPFVGGRDHLSHYLTYIGVSEGVVPLVLGLITGLSGILMIFSGNYIPQWNHVFTGVFAGYVAITIGIFLMLYLRGHKIAMFKEIMKKRRESRDIEAAMVSTRELERQTSN